MLISKDRGVAITHPSYFGRSMQNYTNKMENEEKEKKSWGGARTGSGRKKGSGSTAKSIALRIPYDVVAILDAEKNRSAFIVEAIRFYHKHRNE